MVTARSAAMGFNRLVDARFDALNPRTAMRELPRGAMTHGRGRRLRRRLVGGVRRRGRASSARCASRCRRWRSRSCSGTRSRSGTRPTRSCFSGWRWRSRRSAAGSPPAGAAAAEPWLLGAGHRTVGRRLRRPLCVPGPRVRSRARPAVDSRPLRRGARRCSISRVMHVGHRRSAWRRWLASRRSAPLYLAGVALRRRAARVRAVARQRARPVAGQARVRS